MTSCSPIIDVSSESEFRGALCVDTDITGKLNDFFPVEEATKAQYLILQEKSATKMELER